MGNKNLNLTMLMDMYELTMSNGIFTSDMRDTVTYFDMFFRRVPDKGGYAIMAGLEQLIEYMNNLRFDEDDIEYLRSTNLFNEEFLHYLRHFIFTGDIYAIKEGTVVLHDGLYTQSNRTSGYRNHSAGDGIGVRQSRSDCCGHVDFADRTLWRNLCGQVIQEAAAPVIWYIQDGKPVGVMIHVLINGTAYAGRSRANDLTGAFAPVIFSLYVLL